MVRVKICGITNPADARFALDEGADALGVIFAKSPRQVDAAAAQKVVRAAGPLAAVVGVFVDAPLEKMLRLAGQCGLSAVQLHGDESARTVRELQKRGFRVIKALRVGEGTDLKKVSEIPADMLLFDTAHAGRFGGTGKSFDWTRLKKLKTPVPWIVSGGLDPASVKKMLSVLKPYGVDVSSGVEKSPGKKSQRLVKEFIKNAKSAR